jgi:putative isomerase
MHAHRLKSDSRLLILMMLCGWNAAISRAGTSDPQNVIVSNVLRGAPCGIAWIVNNDAAFVLDTGGPYVAGTAAADDSYHAYRFNHHGANIVFAWGRVGDNVVGRLSSDKQIDINLTLSSGWPDWTSTFTGTPDGVNGTAGNGQLNWKLKTSPKPKSTSDSTVTISPAPDAPVRFVAGLSELPDFKTVDSTLENARQKYAAGRPQASGDWGDFVGAIANNMNNSRLYANDNHLLAHSVSRSWASTPNTSPYFCWDSFFTANLAAIDDPVIARNTVRAILSCESSEGLVPNFCHWNRDGGASMDRSQPPVGSLCVWKMHQRYPEDLDFLREVYPKLVLWHDWWPKYRNAKGDGLLEWGSASGVFQNAQYETGWDDNLHYQGAAMKGTTMNCYSVDLSAMWAMDAHYLALLADALGQTADAARFRKDEGDMNQRINDKLWNESLNTYCSRYWDDNKGSELHFSVSQMTPAHGAFLTRLTPMNFYPLSSGVPDAERAKRVLGVLTDPTRFWGKYLLPTLAYNDPDWHDQEYWKGDVWGPPNYITWVGIRKYASPDQVAQYADRNVRLFMREWLRDGSCSENYLSTDGMHSHDPHYTWGALLNLIGLESIVDVDDSGKIVLNGTLNKNIILKNIPLLGRTFDVNVTPGAAQLIEHGKLMLTAKGEVVRATLK